MDSKENERVLIESVPVRVAPPIQIPHYKIAITSIVLMANLYYAFYSESFTTKQEAIYSTSLLVTIFVENYAIQKQFTLVNDFQYLRRRLRPLLKTVIIISLIYYVFRIMLRGL